MSTTYDNNIITPKSFDAISAAVANMTEEELKAMRIAGVVLGGERANGQQGTQDLSQKTVVKEDTLMQGFAALLNEANKKEGHGFDTVEGAQKPLAQLLKTILKPIATALTEAMGAAAEQHPDEDTARKTAQKEAFNAAWDAFKTMLQPDAQAPDGVDATLFAKLQGAFNNPKTLTALAEKVDEHKGKGAKEEHPEFNLAKDLLDTIFNAVGAEIQGQSKSAPLSKGGGFGIV